MLKSVRIENIVLIDAAQIPFEKGLNILSGETGAGKSAVMKGLHLLAGEKGDPKLIRHGKEKGVVEALFEPSQDHPVWEILERSGLSFETDAPLLLRREISTSGKSRAFVNHQMATLALLKEMGEALFDIASQHASQKLSSEGYQRATLDSWGALEGEIQAFAKSWEEEKRLKEELEALTMGEASRLREIEVCRREIEEIEHARLTPEDEEPLFQRFAELATSEERFSKTEQILADLNQSSAWRLTQQKLEALSEIDPALKPLSELFCQINIELGELTYSLGQYQSRILFNPEQRDRLDDRLKVVSQLKKKYGSTVHEILTWQKERGARLENLLKSDDRIDELKEKLNELTEKNRALAMALSQKRRKSALSLAQKITEELQLLNMAKAEFFIDVEPALRNKYGEDRVRFLFRPNLGSPKIEVKEAASGGELARILLAIKTLLSGTSLLIFDEVDANIGGKTARLLGEKLQELGRHTQVIAITHFPQVAAHADHHLQVQKIEENGKSSSVIRPLSIGERKIELDRMVGYPHA